MSQSLYFSPSLYSLIKELLEVQQPHIHGITGRSAYNWSKWELQAGSILIDADDFRCPDQNGDVPRAVPDIPAC